MDQDKQKTTDEREVAKRIREGEKLLAKSAEALSAAASTAEKVLIAEKCDFAAEPQHDDVRASIPRTTAQHMLYFVSWIALLFGVADIVTSLVSGSAILMGLTPALPTDVTRLGGHVLGEGNQHLLFYGFVIALGLLQMLTGFLGIRAANDSSKVNSFLALCYLVALFLVVVALSAWGDGKLIIFDPMVIITTIIYVGILSNLGEQVRREYDAGVSGTVFMRSRYQRILHFLAVATIGVNAVYLIVLVVLLGVADVGNYVPMLNTADIKAVFAGANPLSILFDAASALFTLFVALIALRGSNNARFIRPFVIIQFLITSLNIAVLVWNALVGGLTSVQAGSVVTVVYNLVMLYLGVRVEEELPDSILARILPRLPLRSVFFRTPSKKCSR
ncbi:hypothetical protein [Lancefieldella sp. Marseille-Q7238]|uniref:hypothetical protein n=1 Tax=Lancefieldella sp. Marseille-Q7238 TaxID=3022127 RepID=UPI0024A88DBF|nr:hypothetical protein [Lancefieldella sp. Marseille-Q7238]